MTQGATNDTSSLPINGGESADPRQHATRLQRLEGTLNEVERVAHLGHWAWHIKTNHLEWSDGMFRIFGVEREGFSGDLAAVVAEAIHPDDRVAVERSNRAVIEQGKREPLEYRVRRHDGTVRVVWAEAAELVCDAEGRPALLTGIVLDITDRKQAEEALRESTARHRRLVETIPGIIYSYSEGRGGTYYSPQVEAVLGYTVQQLLRQPMLFHDAIHADDLPTVDRVIAKKAAGVVELEYRIRDASGRWRWLLDRCVRLTNDDGTTTLEGLALDITDRKRVEEALQESDRSLREAQTIAKLGSYVLNVSTGVWKSSDMLDRLLAIGPDYPRSVDGWLALVHPDDRAMMADYFGHAVLEKGRVFDIEYRIIRQDDRAERWVHGLGTVRRDPEGRPLAMHGTIQDITEHKRAQEERSRLQDQFQQAQKMESVGRLAGGVAHDFNNMLSVILANTDAVLEQADPTQPLHDDLKEIQQAAMRAADLTRQLLAFARKQTALPRIVNLSEAVAGMSKMLQRLIGENIRLTFTSEAGLWPVKVDPTQVDQILANLCVNARDAISDVGQVTIETGNAKLDAEYCEAHDDVAPGQYVRLVVSDNGFGMDKETIAHIFEPFFTTKAVGEGTGLGLATVYGIVKQNNGVINVYSEPGLGSTFTIYLPRHVAGADEAAEGSASMAPTPRGHEVILLVEDEPSILKATKRVLERMGYTVLAASTPGDAIKMSEGHRGPIHMILSDVIMPEMNGRDMASRILSVHPGLKRIFMSGYTSDVIATQGVLDEGVDFIQKPFSGHDLAAKVREVLDRDNYVRT
jgi:PAS domain S-box-containing protein